MKLSLTCFFLYGKTILDETNPHPNATNSNPTSPIIKKIYKHLRYLKTQQLGDKLR